MLTHGALANGIGPFAWPTAVNCVWAILVFISLACLTDVIGVSCHKACVLDLWLVIAAARAEEP